jgi:hypothetical protein
MQSPLRNEPMCPSSSGDVQDTSDVQHALATLLDSADKDVVAGADCGVATGADCPRTSYWSDVLTRIDRVHAMTTQIRDALDRNERQAAAFPAGFGGVMRSIGAAVYSWEPTRTTTNAAWVALLGVVFGCGLHGAVVGNAHTLRGSVLASVGLVSMTWAGVKAAHLLSDALP